MILDARSPEKPAGVLIDTGTGKRIPFARNVNFVTGEYEYLAPAPNGVDILVEPYSRRPIVRKGKAVGKLELVPFQRAVSLGCAAPKRVVSVIQPMTKDEKIAGLEQYKKLFYDVWRWRGDAARSVDPRWEEYLMNTDFLDCVVLKRKVVPVT